MDNREQKLVDFLRKSNPLSSKELFDSVDVGVSYASLKRILSKLVTENYLTTTGQGKATKYLISPVFEVIRTVDLEEYYKKEIDERQIKTTFDFSVLTDVIAKYSVFTYDEISKLSKIHQKYKTKIASLSESEYKNEMERLAIDLSWKSSQIEGNTYSLLETERLLKEKETASGKTKEEAVMLLNHKEAIDFIVENTDYLNPLSVSKIENIHSILIKELDVKKNIRIRGVGITGTNYRPLDNEFQILEALEKLCDVVNNKENIFEKALIILVIISYIQPFMDGNKRTARIVSNAVLMSENYCPLSFRTVDSIEYKKAMLLFYEQNNISAFKNIFINQYEFAVSMYF